MLEALPQSLADGLVLGSMLALGAIGLSLTYSILNFANFAHGSFMAWGAFLALTFLGAFAGVQGLGPWLQPIAPFSFGFGLILALFLAAAGTAALALLLDGLVFRQLRKSHIQITLVFASFGASLLLRSLLVLIYGPEPAYYSREIQIAQEILPGVRMTPDQLFVIALTAVLVVGLHLFLTRTRAGKAMRAMRDNTALAQVTGIATEGVVRLTWIIGGSLAAVAGVFYGVTVQILPEMELALILPLFAAVILGGVGSVYGAVLGGLIIGIAMETSALVIDPAYKPAVAFAVMIAVLLVRPTGLFGERN